LRVNWRLISSNCFPAVMADRGRDYAKPGPIIRFGRFDPEWTEVMPLRRTGGMNRENCSDAT